MINVQQALLLVAVGSCVVAAAVDVKTGFIPNWITLGLLAGAPAVHAAAAFAHHHAWAPALVAFLESVASAIVCALVPVLLHVRGGLGMGDVKLFAALGATCGAFVGLYVQTYAYVFGLLYAIVLLVHRGTVRRTLGNVGDLLRNRGPADDESRRATFTELRFAPAILAAVCLAAWTRWQS